MNGNGALAMMSGRSPTASSSLTTKHAALLSNSRRTGLLKHCSEHHKLVRVLVTAEGFLPGHQPPSDRTGLTGPNQTMPRQTFTAPALPDPAPAGGASCMLPA